MNKLLFNPNANDSVVNRSIWKGELTGIIDLTNIKYDWADTLYCQMRNQFWIPQEVDMTQDKNDFRNLTKDERESYIGTLGYLTYLDSLQVRNLPHLKSHVTAPDVLPALSEQESQEALHVKCYQHIANSVLNSDEQRRMYSYWKEDKILKDRCQYIANMYQEYIDKGTEESYFYALLADYVLESLYFYLGFIVFYSLRSRQLMLSTAEMITLINRDEQNHVALHRWLLLEAMKVFPHSKEKIEKIFRDTVEQELRWTNHIIGDDFIGMSSAYNAQYIKYLANSRYSALKLGKLYPEVSTNPYLYLEKASNISNEGTTKECFFSTNVTGYQLNAVDWTDF